MLQQFIFSDAQNLERKKFPDLLNKEKKVLQISKGERGEWFESQTSIGN